MVGYTVGGGVEYMWFPNWIIRGEYRYNNYGALHPTFFAFQSSPDIDLAARIKVTSQIATLGIAWKVP